MLKLLLAGTFILTYASPAFAQDVVEFQRVGRWQVDYDTEACHLAAKFGGGKDELVARLTRFSGEDSFDLWLTGASLKALAGASLRADGNRASVKVNFGTGLNNERQAIVGKSDQPVLIIMGLRFDGLEVEPGHKDPVVLPQITPDVENKVTGATITVERRKPFRLVFGSLEKPLQAMRTCVDDMVKEWGYDPAVQNQVKQRPVALIPVQKLFDSGDFPREMLRQGFDGLVRYRLDVDEQGSVGSCHIVYRAQKDDFAKTTCAIMSKKAKFKPALDVNGKAVRSYVVGRAWWEIEG